MASVFAPLQSYLHTIAPLKDEDWQQLAALLSVKYFEQKQCFQTSGTQCRTVGFLLKGCFRWVRNIDGVERTFDFAQENSFVTDYLSILTQTPGGADIVAVEDSVVACVDARALLALFDTSPIWQRVGRKLAEGAACYALQRLVDAYYGTPRARYERLMQTSPGLFQRVPPHILASYLGMTWDNLSLLLSQ